jgi:ubiquinol-cytochrome c reductase cytochrome b subunit
MPLIIVIIVLVHLMFLHETGSSNPSGANLNRDKIPFHPYFVIKDFFVFFIIVFLFVYIVLNEPYVFGDPENFRKANPLITPVHIQPE